MQIYAIDPSGNEIAAPHAKPKKDYRCPFCHEPLRLRSGPFIRTHFYHFRPGKACLHKGKSLTHLRLQENLLTLLPAGDAKEEARFPEIGRVADIFWIKEKIVFEVQVSFISQEEVKERIEAYQTLGLEVVWILHTGRFDRKKVTAAEKFLKNHTHYFSNHDPQGLGIFFDQFVYEFKGIKECALFKRAVDLAAPQRKTPFPLTLPPSLSCRSTWRLTFHRDILSSPHFSPYDWEKALELEALYAAPPSKKGIWQSIQRVFRFVGYLLLEFV
jgi:competence protein CoiA